MTVALRLEVQGEQWKAQTAPPGKSWWSPPPRMRPPTCRSLRGRTKGLRVGGGTKYSGSVEKFTCWMAQRERPSGPEEYVGWRAGVHGSLGSQDPQYMVMRPGVGCGPAWDLLWGVYQTRMLMYSGSHSCYDAMCTVIFRYVHYMWFKWNNIWLLISVDQRHGTRIHEHSCLRLLCFLSPSRFLCN